jgi:gas vesicle protein
MNLPHRTVLLALALAVPFATIPAGCSSTMIAAREKLGYAKRDQLVDKVSFARDSQTEAKKQFESALHEFLVVTQTEGSATTRELEDRYRKLKSEFERCQSRADSFRSRIDQTETVATALFNEWKAELKQYQSDELRRASEEQLNSTRQQYDKLIQVMKNSAKKMDPVVAAFKDQVLYLKHNLNARAIAALQTQAGQLQTDVDRLVKEMEASIAEANAFIQQMQQSQG